MTDSAARPPRQWFINPVAGYKCEVNESGIGLTGNEVHVIEFSAYQALLAENAHLRVATGLDTTAAEVMALALKNMTEERDKLLAERDALKLTGRKLNPVIRERDRLAAELAAVKAELAEYQKNYPIVVTEWHDFEEDNRALTAELAQVKAELDHLKNNSIPLESFNVSVPSDEWYDTLKERDALRAKCAVYEKALEFYASGENIYVGTLGLQEGKHGGPLGTIARAALAPSGGGTE